MKRPRIWIPWLTRTGWTRRDGKGGWLRLWPDGPGWTWCLKTEPLLFSQRQRLTRYVHIGRWRVRYLPSLRAKLRADATALANVVDREALRIYMEKDR